MALTLGSNSSQPQVVLDNVRLVRTDVDSSIVLTLPKLNSGTLSLLPGSKPGAYRFSVYVRDDPSALVSNRMHPSGLTLMISAAVKSGSGFYQKFYPRSSSWTGWTQIKAEVGFDFVNSNQELNTTPALTIKLIPTNRQDKNTLGEDAGSLLVAQPMFTFNP